MHILRCFYFILLVTIVYQPSYAQKILQLEKKGKVATTKIYLGESIFLKTQDDPDYWFEGELEDLMVEAQAIVFENRIIPLKDIISIKRRKRSAANGVGRGLQVSALIPAGYEVIYGVVNPPIEWKSLAIFSGGTFALGSILRLFPPKQYKMGKKYRLRVIDLTF